MIRYFRELHIRIEKGIINEARRFGIGLWHCMVYGIALCRVVFSLHWAS